MKKLTIVVLGLGLGLGLAGCGEETKTKSYYVSEENEKERISKIAWCEESADRLETINCKNALNAAEELETERVKKQAEAVWNQYMGKN